MTQGNKVISLNGKSVFTGQHRINFRGNSPTIGKLTIQTTPSTKQTTCKLSLSTKVNGNKVSVQYVDKGCNGVESAKYRLNDGKWKKVTTRSQKKLPTQFQKPNQVMDRALKQVVFSTTSGRLRAYRKLISQNGSPYGFRARTRRSARTYITPQITRQPAKTIQAKTYFATDKAKLLSTKALDKFVKNYSGGPIIVEGHCDFRGGVEYNLELGGKRARVTKEYLQQAFKDAGKPVPPITTISYGESQSRSAKRTDRRAVATSAVKVIDHALKSVKGDVVYLIDSSGSMRGKLWNQVRAYFRANRVGKGRLFNFDSKGVKRGLGRVDGGTHLWDSIHDTIAGTKDNPDPLAHKFPGMRKGQHLVVLTDGIDEGSEHTAEEVRKLASDRGIKLSIIFLGEYKR